MLVGSIALAREVKLSFFPKDFSYLSYVDVWLPEDASLSATKDKAVQADAVIRQVATDYAKARGRSVDEMLESITTFAGGGGPRFWFSVAPELQQLNYAQLIVQLKDKHDTHDFAMAVQSALSAQVAGARLDVRELETAKPIGVPVAVRILGSDVQQLRAIGEQVKSGKPLTGRVIAARPRMREIGVDGNDPAKTRRAWTSRQGRPPARKSVQRAAIGLGSRPSWRG
jgi:multidrug efflux pump subunit AcrB